MSTFSGSFDPAIWGVIVKSVERLPRAAGHAHARSLARGRVKNTPTSCPPNIAFIFGCSRPYPPIPVSSPPTALLPHHAPSRPPVATPPPGGHPASQHLSAPPYNKNRQPSPHFGPTHNHLRAPKEPSRWGSTPRRSAQARASLRGPCRARPDLRLRHPDLRLRSVFEAPAHSQKK